jgi:hypothetical protein
MKLWRLSLILLTTGALTLPASAGIIFGKKPTKPDPAMRVPQLIVIVKTDKDESKRVSAAEELRQFDPAAFPDLVPVLIDVMMNDDKPSVRSEAAESLGKIRPVSKEVGWALEQVEEKDKSWRVRTKARYVLLGYHWAGYHADPNMVTPGKEPVKMVTPMPGTGSPMPPQVIVTPTPPKSAPPANRPVGGETPAPPLADPATKTAPTTAPRQLPTGPAEPPAQSAAPAKVAPAPLPLIPMPVPTTPPAKTEPSGLPAIPLPPADGSKQ